MDNVHLPQLIQDLAVLLITGALVSLLFKRLKQPIVLGYLVAGFLVGPHIAVLPTVTDTKSIQVWADIGVIFLLFGLGLDFSFKRLAKVGKSASITAFFEISFMLGLGFLIGQLLGWSKMDSVFLGGILSISSTTIIVRAFEELGLKGKSFVHLVLGVLIFEDLIAVLLMVMLSSLAVSDSLSGATLLFSFVKLSFFLLVWFTVGIYLLPIFLNKVRAQLSEETMLMVSIGLCLVMVMIASQTGFSPALGAFVMGSILGETKESHRIEKIFEPVRNLFAAVFFISVGILINPQAIYDHFATIILITLFFVFGKLFSVTIGALIAGRSLKSSIQAGVSLTQIGEFSFIIATLGVTLKVTSGFLYPIAVAISVLTTFFTPYFIKFSDQFYNYVEQQFSPQMKERLLRYERAMSASSGQSLAALIGRIYGFKIILNSVIVIAIALTMHQLGVPLLIRFFESEKLVHILAFVLTLLMAAPFLWAVVVSPPAQFKGRNSDLARLDRLQFGISLARFLNGLGLIIIIVGVFSTVNGTIAAAILSIFVTALYFSKYTEPFYLSVERRFISNLSEKEGELELNKPLAPELAPWNASLVEFVVSPNSTVVAKTLQNIAIKEKFGVTVAMIERGDRKILAPGREEILLPFDRTFAIGTEDQLAQLRNLLEVSTSNTRSALESFGLEALVLDARSEFIDKSIRECGLREKVSGLIVGIERQGQRILNPDSSMVLASNDLLWIVGDIQLIKRLKRM